MSIGHARGLAAMALALSLAGLGAPAPGLAAGVADLAGTWTGTLDRDGRPVPVILELKAAQPGQDAGKLRFGQPDQCALPLTLSADGPVPSLALGASNGGRCAGYALGRLAVARGAGAVLDIAVTKPDGGAGPKAGLVAGDGTATTAALAGTYKGSYVKRNGNTVPFTLALAPATTGKPAGSISFDAPDSCRNSLEFSGPGPSGALVLTPSSGNGGPCDTWTLGTLTLTRAGTGLRAVMLRPDKGQAFATTASP